MLLKVANLTKGFGGLKAVNDVSFEILSNEGSLGIIGPNGAGKTTLINLISGLVKPERGRIYFKGQDVTYWSPEKRVRVGIIRTFQLVSVFENLDVLSNVCLSLTSKPLTPSTFFGGFKRFPQSVVERAWEILRLFRLEKDSEVIVANLPHGKKRMLETAMAFALRPRLLLLDEPFAGLSDTEISEMVEILKGLKNDVDCLLIVEHKISWLENLVNRVIVMNGGKIIADSSYKQVLEDPNVQSVYWGLTRGEHTAS